MPESPQLSAPLSVHDVAARIAAERGACNYSSVYRAIRRLKLLPYARNGAFKFYSEGQLPQIAAALRAPNKTKPYTEEVNPWLVDNLDNSAAEEAEQAGREKRLGAFLKERRRERRAQHRNTPKTQPPTGR